MEREWGGDGGSAFTTTCSHHLPSLCPGHSAFVSLGHPKQALSLCLEGSALALHITFSSQSWVSVVPLGPTGTDQGTGGEVEAYKGTAVFKSLF